MTCSVNDRLSMKPLADCRLYAFVDSAYLAGRRPSDIARALCDGGADLIQLRAKGALRDEARRWAGEVMQVCRAAGVWFVVNDYPDIATELGAPLCHLGQEDFFAAGYRRVNEVFPEGNTTGLGLSTHAPDQAERALRAGPAYIAIGPVYATPTKPGRPPVTLDYVRWAAQHVQIPWFAIGGITLDNLEEVLRAGARRICVVSAILQAEDIAGACREFRERLGG